MSDCENHSYVTEYYTSYSYKPVQDVAASTETGAATNIIYGLSLGYKSTIVPAACITRERTSAAPQRPLTVRAVTIFVAYGYGAMYGISLAALGMLGTLTIGLTIDAYGPISDNAGGIAEMAEFGAAVRAITDTLDAAGTARARATGRLVVAEACSPLQATQQLLSAKAPPSALPLWCRWRFSARS